ncbi:tRNA cyclic N6-threonylcarbamoyladenosine(37) synthase TcdA [Marinobacteraceae bacterium S3BR75-40.1]
MMTEGYKARFSGIERLYGRQALTRFHGAHVAVVGLGGVGSWAAEALVRSGVGAITLIDLDEVCISNTNRQLHALDGQVGRPKVDALGDRLAAINPECRIVRELAFVTAANVERLIGAELDGVIDAIDSIKAKAALIAHCKRQRIPVVCAGGAGGQIDPTQVTVADLSRTTQDPLLAKLRNKLRREYGFSRNPKRRFGIEAVYSTEQLVYPASDGEVCYQKPAEGGPVRLDCATGFGASSCVTATFGFVAASRMLARLARQARAEEPNPESAS